MLALTAADTIPYFSHSFTIHCPWHRSPQLHIYGVMDKKSSVEWHWPEVVRPQWECNARNAAMRHACVMTCVFVPFLLCVAKKAKKISIAQCVLPRKAVQCSETTMDSGLRTIKLKNVKAC